MKAREGMELIENLLQLLATFLGALLSGVRLPEKPQAGVLSAALLLRLLCPRRRSTGRCICCCSTPRRASFYVSEFGWVASVIFLRILQATLTSQDDRSFRSRRAWLAPAFGVPLLAFYCIFGDILSNLIWCGMMIWLSFCAIRGIAYAKTQTGAARNMRHFHIGVLCFVVSEYLLWTVGCFWPDTSPASPTFWCDMLLTLAISGAAARHEKGGGGMTYIENIFLCMVSPLLVAALCMGRRQLALLPVLHRRDGGVPALGLYQHLPRGGVPGGRPCRHGGDRAGGGGNYEAAAAGVLSARIRAGGG